MILLVATAIALVCANSPIAEYYSLFWTFTFLHKPLTFWTNDLLMGIFFFAIGLELKREILEGELSSFKKAALPIAGAFGGMLVPALIYYWINRGLPSASGWGVPVATDIAFAIGIMSLLGKLAPNPAKVFLTALAVVDDLGALLVIGLFYSSSSALHPAVLGVLIAGFVPLRFSKKLEHALHPWVVNFIMPVFALANAGVSFSKFNPGSPIGLGVILGLVFGKQIGITLFSWLSVKLNIAHLPSKTTWLQVFGVGCFGGIGFTMSIFIANLAFPIFDDLEQAKLGILIASALAALSGLAVFMFGRAVSTPQQS